MTENEKIARRIAASQGRAPILLGSATEEEITALAALDGAEDLPLQFAEWLSDYRDARKATVDDDEAEEQ